jgi:hypothetical protein
MKKIKRYTVVITCPKCGSIKEGYVIDHKNDFPMERIKDGKINLKGECFMCNYSKYVIKFGNRK